MLVCVYYCAFGTRDRGCSRHPAFPAPSVSTRANDFANLGRNRAARTIFVVPANAGTHTPRRVLLEKLVDGFARATPPRGYGSLRSQGRRGDRAVPPLLIPLTPRRPAHPPP